MLVLIPFVLDMQVWLEFMDGAVRESSKEKIDRNREAQHKYLTWRAEKVWSIFHKKRIVCSMQ